MVPLLTRRRGVAVALCCFSFLLIGWSALLVPALSTEVEAAFGQTDAGLGGFYFITAAAYAAGSIVGGMAIERVGRRSVLVLAAALHLAGLVALGSASNWTLFVAAGVLRSVGGGAIDGGVNGLVVDLFGRSRGRALSFVHIFYALGAVGAPFLLAFRGSIGLSPGRRPSSPPASRPSRWERWSSWPRSRPGGGPGWRAWSVRAQGSTPSRC